MLECDYFDRDSTRNGSCQSAISKWTGDISPDGKDEEIVKNSSSGMMLTSVMPGGKHPQPGRAGLRAASHHFHWRQSSLACHWLVKGCDHVSFSGGQLVCPHSGHSQASTLSTFQVSHISSVTTQSVTPCILSDSNSELIHKAK